MEAIQLLSFILAIIIVCLAQYRRRRSTARSHRQPTIKIRDAAVARQALIEQADVFSNRPATPFPVPLITGRRRRSQSHGLTTVPYGPHWRALRSNLNAAILQPWRQGLLAPLQQDAVDAHVAGLGAGDVVIRHKLYPAVFSMLARVCFGDDVDARHVRSMEPMMLEFTAAIAEAKVFARSTMARLWHWRKWRRFLAFRSQQAALFVPLIEAARRRRQRTGHHDGAGDSGGVRRPYLDTLIDNRSIPDEDDPRDKRALTEGEMVSLVVEFFGAAEGVVTALEWTLAHLVNQPEIQAKLRREVIAGNHGHGGGDADDGSVSDKCPAGRSTTYLHAVVLEGLRLHPPFQLVMREVRSEGAVVGTATVPAGGMRVQFMLGDIGKDSRLWTDPDEFRPERFLPGGEGEDVGPVPAGPKEIRMMPFGAGQRACPGASMAVQFIKDFLAPLVREFEWTAAALPTVGEEGSGSADGGGVDMTELYGFITKMKSPLRAHITPRA
ncbi:cytochrome P450 89A2-like [Miscanthus floridulus]|uniref:cytochrome P450 89A2-like n=1 Tax=Miscanthus floridulus TaxID=154761 RepID=UPI0034598483